MNENLPYQKYFKIAFYSNMVGIVLTFAFSGNIGILGTILIMLAVLLAVIGIIKKKKHEKQA